MFKYYTVNFTVNYLQTSIQYINLLYCTALCQQRSSVLSPVYRIYRKHSRTRIVDYSQVIYILVRILVYCTVLVRI